MNHYYKAKWEWFCEAPDRCYWRAPGGNNTGAVDLRSNTDAGKLGGTPEGFAVFAYSEPQVIADAEYLGTDSAAVGDFIWTKLTVEADPSGITAPKPLTGRAGKEVELYLAGEKIKSEPFTEEHKQRTVEVFQNDFRKNADKYPKEVLQKWVGAKMKEIYEEMSDEKAELLVPEEHKKGEKLWKEPETVIGDTFVDTNGVNLQAHTATGTGGGFSWANVTGSNLEIQSNVLQMEGTGDGDRDYRAETDLSSDNMYAKATVGTLSSGFDCSVAVRFSTSARTHYQTEWGTGFRRISKFVAGSHTIITSDGGANSAGDILEVRVSGSNVQAWRNGVQVLSNQTDTAITGHLRTGLGMYDDASTWDTFEAGDFTSVITLDSMVHGDTDTQSITVASNANRLLIVAFGTHQGGGPSGVSYGGVGLTKIKEEVGSFSEQVSIWGLLNPTAGTANVTLSGVGSYRAYAAYSLYNVDQNTLPSITGGASGAGSTASHSITPDVDNCWIIDSCTAEDDLTMTTTSGVSDSTEIGLSYENVSASHFIQTTAAAKTMSYALGSGQRWVHCSVAIKPYGSPAAGGNTTNFFHFF